MEPYYDASNVDYWYRDSCIYLVRCKVLQFAPIPRIQFELWYCPYPISTWIASQGSLTAIIWVILTFLLAALIWFPFFKAYEKQCIEEEANNG